jgi:hypothetical protein
MTRGTGRTAKCGRKEAQARLLASRAFVSVAELVHAEPDDPVLPLRGVAAAVAVLGAIAAAAAICCARLGAISRGEDHDQAVDLLAKAHPEGSRVKNDLRRLLSIKDKVHYQAIIVTPKETEAAIRQAKRVLRAAEEAFGSQ